MSETSKLRAVTLAALMVCSVFAGAIAFSGSAAADNHEFTYEGGAAHYQTGGQAVVEVPFNSNVDSASLTAANFTLTDDDENVSDAITDISASGGTVTVETNEVVRSNDLELELSGDIRNATGETLANDGTYDVDFAAVTVGADGDVNAYKGSKVAVVADSGSTDVEIVGTDDDNNYFRSGNTGTNSEVYIFDTSNRQLGEYEVTYENGSTATVTVRQLGLSANIDDTNITTDDDVEGNVTANAGNRDVDVVLLDGDDDEVASDTVSLSGQGEADFSFDVSDTGDYTVEATDLDSGVTNESESITVSKAGEGRADVAEGVVTEQRGDIANITVDLQNTDTATLTVGDDDVGYRTNVTVEDGSDDGQVTVQFNTYEASIGNAQNAFEVADSDDSIENVEPDSQNQIDSLLDAGEYPLEVRSGDDASVDAEGVGTLVLEERNTSALDSWTAASGTDFEDTEAVYEAVQNSNLTQDDQIAYGDLAVHQLQASGLEGAIDANDDDATSEFWSLEQSGAVDLTVEQTDAGANRDPYEVQLAQSNTTVVADADNDTYFIVYDTDEVGTTGDDIEADDGLTANFTVAADEGNLTADDEKQTVEDEYEIVDAEHTLDEPVNVSAAANQTIEGETTVAPGTELSLRVRSSGDTQPSFLKTATVYVSENETFSSTFDFSEQEAGDTFDVTVRGGVADSETVDGNVGEGGANETETDTNETVTETETMTETGTPAEGTETGTPAEGTETAAPTDGETGTPAEGTGTSTGTPGFGVVVAVTALLAAAFVAVRRD